MVEFRGIGWLDGNHQPEPSFFVTGMTVARARNFPQQVNEWLYFSLDNQTRGKNGQVSLLKSGPSGPFKKEHVDWGSSRDRRCLETQPAAFDLPPNGDDQALHVLLNETHTTNKCGCFQPTRHADMSPIIRWECKKIRVFFMFAAYWS